MGNYNSGKTSIKSIIFSNYNNYYNDVLNEK